MNISRTLNICLCCHNVMLCVALIGLVKVRNVKTTESVLNYWFENVGAVGEECCARIVLKKSQAPAVVASISSVVYTGDKNIIILICQWQDNSLSGVGGQPSEPGRFNIHSLCALFVEVE